MSLSFVSSAILSSSDGISHNEEQTIESNETKSLRSKDTTSHIPLFDQIKKNQDLEQQKLDEEFKIRQMGTRGLDEEDCAHLESIESMREEKERLMKKREMEEVDLFRAARAERSFIAQTKTKLIDDDKGSDVSQDEIVEPVKKPAIVAPIIIKKKRRINNDKDDKKDGSNSADIIENNKIDNTKKNNGATVISSLLGAYDSDSSGNDGD